MATSWGNLPGASLTQSSLRRNPLVAHEP